MAEEGLNLFEADEWYKFFAKNELNVFDVLHGAIATAVVYWPDEFMQRRDRLAWFLMAKKSSPSWFLRPNNNKSSPSWSPRRNNNTDDDQKEESSDFSDSAAMCPPPPASVLVEESPPTDQKVEATTKTDQVRMKIKTKAKLPTTCANKDHDKTIPPLPEKIDLCKPGMSPASVLPREETIMTTTGQKTATRKKNGLIRRLVKQKDQDQSKDKDVHVSDRKQLVCKNTVLDKKIGGKFREDVSRRSTRPEVNKGRAPPHDGQQAKSSILSSSSTAANTTTSGFTKDNPVTRADLKLQTIHDEAALERKLEASKRKLRDGYKNAEAAKKRIRLIDPITQQRKGLD